MLAVIEAEIAARDLPYTTEVVQNGSDVTLPLGFDPSIPGISQWLNVLERVAALRRTDVPLIEKDQGVYTAARFRPRPDHPHARLDPAWRSSTPEGQVYNVIGTHLEVQDLAPVQVAQTAELIGSIMNDLDGITILVGDLNSNAAAAPGDPTWTATYDATSIDAGFQDVWMLAPGPEPDPGLTCCHPKDLMGTAAFRAAHRLHAHARRHPIR